MSSSPWTVVVVDHWLVGTIVEPLTIQIDLNPWCKSPVDIRGRNSCLGFVWMLIIWYLESKPLMMPMRNPMSQYVIDFSSLLPNQMVIEPGHSWGIAIKKHISTVRDKTPIPVFQEVHSYWSWGYCLWESYQAWRTIVRPWGWFNWGLESYLRCFWRRPLIQEIPFEDYLPQLFLFI